MSSHNVTAGTPTAFTKLPPQDVLPVSSGPVSQHRRPNDAGVGVQRRVEPRRLQADAPNILIVLIDDAGPGLPSTFGGELLHRPSTESPRKALPTTDSTPRRCAPPLERLSDGTEPPSCRGRTDRGDGERLGRISGVMPKSCATAAEVLRHYGYTTSAWGKWHNTPAEQTTAAGPFDCWPTGYGFDYFYGFLCGEASQYEPNLVRNTTYVAQPRTREEGYHLSEDLADDAIGWLRKHKAFQPDKPFYIFGRRCDPWSAPHHEGVGRQYKASSTMAGTRIVSACSRGRNTRDGFLRRPSSRRAIRGCRRGTAFQRMRSHSSGA